MKPYKRGRYYLLRFIILVLLVILISLIVKRCCLAENLKDNSIPDPIETVTCTMVFSSAPPLDTTPVETCLPVESDDPEAPIVYIDPYELVDYYLDNMMAACVEGDSEEGLYWQILRENVILMYNLDTRIINYEDLWWMSKIIYAEAGADFLTDELQCLVGAVLYNRWLSPEFPDTIEECVFQKGQYSPAQSSTFKSATPDERSVSNAVKVLNGEFSIPETVIFQANFKQGSGTYKKIYSKELGTYSYFCYSNYPELYEVK